MDGQFNELVARLRSVEDENLVSVIVYGSAIAAPGNPKKTDYQLVIVTRRLAANDLHRVRPIVQWWTSSGYAMPTFFMASEFKDSFDVYPIEFSMMKRAYQVLYGLDLLRNEEVSKVNLRWQTEHELRGKLLRLRSLYLPASASAHDLTRLMTESVVSFVRFLRPVLELIGEEPPLGRLATVRLIGERLKIDASPLVRVLLLRDEPKELMELEAQDLFAGYLDSLSRMIEAVNHMES